MAVDSPRNLHFLSTIDENSSENFVCISRLCDSISLANRDEKKKKLEEIERPWSLVHTTTRGRLSRLFSGFEKYIFTVEFSPQKFSKVIFCDEIVYENLKNVLARPVVVTVSALCIVGHSGWVRLCTEEFFQIRTTSRYLHHRQHFLYILYHYPHNKARHFDTIGFTFFLALPVFCQLSSLLWALIWAIWILFQEKLFAQCSQKSIISDVYE